MIRAILAALVLVMSLAGALVAGPEAARAAETKERPDALARQHLEVKPLAIVGGTIHPVTSAAIQNGTLLLKDGKIRAILGDGVALPAIAKNWQVIDARGLHVYPGLIVSSADGLGIMGDAYAGGSEAIVARPVAESFDPYRSDVELATSAGITSAVIWVNAFQPKGALSGRAALLKMSFGEPRDLVVRDPVAMRASSLILTPSTRREFEAALKKAGAKPGPRPSARPHAGRPKPGNEGDPLRELESGRIPLVANPGNPGTILSMVEMADALDLHLVLSLSTDAWQVADTLHSIDAAAIQNVRPSWGTPRGDRRASLGGGWRPDAPTILTRAGVPTALCPLNDSIRVWGVGGRDLLDLPMEAAFAQRSGLTAEEALAAITIIPARIFGAEDRIGSLEVGKDADVILADGDLLDYRTFVRKTIVNGRVAYDAATSRHWKNVIALRDGTDQAK